jgi:hypothetical protein
MKLAEALEATETGAMIVGTKTGAEYAVYRDTLETFEDFIYGHRTNAEPAARFRRGRGAENGDIRWFYLKNVTLVTPNF